MMRIMLKSKIFYATIKELQLYYRGSITIDTKIMEEADLIEGERVDVLNLNSGGRFQTYVIKGERNTGSICLNGPAARLAHAGDKVIILSYGLYSEKELENLETKYVELDEENKVKNTLLR